MDELMKSLPAVLYRYVIHPDGSAVFDYLTDSATKILGVSPEEVIADSNRLNALIHPEDLGSMLRSSERSLANASDWYWTGRMVLKGEERWMEIRSNYEKREDGVIVRRGVIQDVTERRESLKESEQRYQTLVERLPMGIVVHTKGEIIFANSEARRILRAGEFELVGTHVLDYVHPDYRDARLDKFHEVANMEPAQMVEQKYITVDGNEIEVEATAYPLIYKGTPSTQIIFRDITERKQAQRRIKKNETMFTQLFQNVPIAVVLLDADGKVDLVNRGFEEMFGIGISELKAKNLNDFIVPEHLRNEGVDLNNLITSNKVVRLNTIRKHRDGRIVNVLLYGVPIIQEAQIIGIYGVYIDITDRMKVEEELKIRNAELDNFVYKVSHDLRAPLSSVLGLVNLAQLPGNDDNPREYIRIIGEKVEQLDNFISDVLSHSKNLKIEVTTSNVDFRSAIENTFNDLNYLDGANQITRSVVIEGTEFHSDPWRVSEIFRNLISNAIKYRRMDSADSEVNIRVNVNHLCADIAFWDNGIGIDEDNLNKIFEMFFRATEQSDGSGIGLYIVKNAVDKLGGQIQVFSKPGEGTRFNITLPNQIRSSISKITPLVEEAG